MARSYMHLWQWFSPCPINWFIQSAAQYTDPAQTMPILQQTSMRWSYQSMHAVRWMFYLYNWYNFEAINLFLHILFNYFCQNCIFVSSKLICPSTLCALTLNNILFCKSEILFRKSEQISHKSDIISRESEIITRKQDIISRKRDIINKITPGPKEATVQL